MTRRPSISLCFGLLCFLSATPGVEAQHEHHGSMPVGYHEFRLFGGDGKFYLSHFPMFSSIHAFQYIVEVEFDDDSKQAMAKEAMVDVKHDRRYQLSPYHKGKVSADRAEDEADWVLPDTLQAGKSFTGDIFYFAKTERQVVSRNATVTVKGIVWKEELNPKFPRPTALTYLLFGTPKAAFLAHQISAPPKPGRKDTDFDQILSIDILTSTPALSPERAAKRVMLAGTENLESNRLQPGRKVKLSQIGNDQAVIEVLVTDEFQLDQLPTQR